MLTVAEALAKVLANTGRTQQIRVPLAESLGLALAEDIVSDVDSPPHDKSMVDGYAVVADDLATGEAELSILEEVTAGAVPTVAVTHGHCTRIMTGAPLPAGADAVAMIERTELLPSGARVRISGPVESAQNILRQGTSLRTGEIVLKSGHEIRPPEIGLLAEVGAAEVQVFARPRVAILSTGNELVEPHQRPAAGQIRNSNGSLLAAATRRAGAMPIELGIARDEPAELRAKIKQGLAADVLVLSGGVSAGVLDLVPSVLAELGVEQIFHKVNLKPGKPMWFGVAGSKFNVQDSKSDASDVDSPTLNVKPGTLNPDCGTLNLKPETLKLEQRTLVFGVPGNPVSSLVCFELFVRPAIAKLSGRDAGGGLRRLAARLGSDFAQRGDRETYFPAMVRRDRETIMAEPVRWRGSADLCGITSANALAVFPAGDRMWRVGDSVEVVLL